MISTRFRLLPVLLCLCAASCADPRRGGGGDDDDAVDDDDSGSGDDDDTTALQDDGCQWECDGAGVRFGARAIGQGATSLSCLFVLAAVRRRRPERTECSS